MDINIKQCAVNATNNMQGHLGDVSAFLTGVPPHQAYIWSCSHDPSLVLTDTIEVVVASESFFLTTE